VQIPLLQRNFRKNPLLGAVSAPNLCTQDIDLKGINPRFRCGAEQRNFFGLTAEFFG
jgi:hypothetical protein